MFIRGYIQYVARFIPSPQRNSVLGYYVTSSSPKKTQEGASFENKKRWVSSTDAGVNVAPRVMSPRKSSLPLTRSLGIVHPTVGVCTF